MNFKNTKFYPVFLIVGQTMLILGIALFALNPFSCRVSTEGIQVLSGDYTSPVLNQFTVVNEGLVQLKFSRPVQLAGVVVSPVLAEISDSDICSADFNLSRALSAAAGEYGALETEVSYLEGNTVVNLNITPKTQIGGKYEVYSQVFDERGNSLTFCYPFTGYNGQVPNLIFTEVQIKYTKATLSSGTEYRSEYAEFLCLSDGNLAGLKLFSASDGEDKAYVFPAVEVTAGEIILVHLRASPEGSVSEDGENLNLAKGFAAVDGIRDLWDTNTTARFNDNSDVIVLKDCIHNKILDGVMYAAEGTTEWKEEVAPYAELLCSEGIYDSADTENAAVSKGTTPKKSLCRNNAKNIRDEVLKGESVEYPVVTEGEGWSVQAVSPGEL